MAQGTSFKVGGAQPIDRRYQLNSPLISGPGLPSVGARDGDTFAYRALASATGAALNARWNFIFDSTDNYWYPNGCAPLTSEVDTAENTTLVTYGNLATVGPRITLPFGGDYLYMFGAQMLNTTAGDFAAMSLDFGSGAGDADAAFERGSGTTDAVSVGRHRVKTGIAVSTIVTAKYRSGTAGNTSQFINRYLNVLPLRVR